MSSVASVFVLTGALVTLFAGAGILRFATPFARFHAAGKASPVAFLLVSIGASVELGWASAALFLVASAAMVLTLPIGVHLLFRATHRSSPGDHLVIDDLLEAERLAGKRNP